MPQTGSAFRNTLVLGREFFRGLGSGLPVQPIHGTQRPDLGHRLLRCVRCPDLCRHTKSPGPALESSRRALLLCTRRGHLFQVLSTAMAGRSYGRFSCHRTHAHPQVSSPARRCYGSDCRARRAQDPCARLPLCRHSGRLGCGDHAWNRINHQQYGQGAFLSGVLVLSADSRNPLTQTLFYLIRILSKNSLTLTF